MISHGASFASRTNFLDTCGYDDHAQRPEMVMDRIKRTQDFNQDDTMTEVNLEDFDAIPQVLGHNSRSEDIGYSHITQTIEAAYSRLTITNLSQWIQQC